MNPTRRGLVALLVMTFVLGPSLVSVNLSATTPDEENVQSDPQYDEDRNRILDTLDAFMAETDGDQEHYWVIVRMLNDVDYNSVAALKEAVGDFTVQGLWSSASAFGAEMTEAQVQALADRSDVKHVYSSTRAGASFSLATARGATGVNVTFDPNVLSLTGDLDNDPGNFTEDDVVVCVVDTGIQVQHRAFAAGYGYQQQVSNLSYWKDFTAAPNATPLDQHGHGSQMSSIIAGHDMQTDNTQAPVGGVYNNTTAPHRGVAPSVTLASVRVTITGVEQVEVTNFVNGILWCAGEFDDPNTNVTEHLGFHRVDVISGSFGIDVNPENCQATPQANELNGAAQTAVNKGIIAVFAAGNTGPAECTLDQPSNVLQVLSVGMVSDPKNGVCDQYFPGRAPTDVWSQKGSGWYLAHGSSRGSLSKPVGAPLVKPDILAPGACISAAKAETTTTQCTPITPCFNYTEGTGTSPAAAFVAGVAALMLDLVGRKVDHPQGSLTPAMVMEALKTTAMAPSWGLPVNATFDGVDADFGAGVIKARAAVIKACQLFYAGNSSIDTLCKVNVTNNVDPAQPAHFTPSPVEDLGAAPAKDVWDLQVNSSPAWPIAITVVHPNWPTVPTFDLKLFPPGCTGELCAIPTNSAQRQNTLVVHEPQAGTYKLHVENNADVTPGVKPYWLDVSVDGTLASTPNPDQ